MNVADGLGALDRRNGKQKGRERGKNRPKTTEHAALDLIVPHHARHPFQHCAHNPTPVRPCCRGMSRAHGAARGDR